MQNYPIIAILRIHENYEELGRTCIDSVYENLFLNSDLNLFFMLSVTLYEQCAEQSI